MSTTSACRSASRESPSVKPATLKQSRLIARLVAQARNRGAEIRAGEQGRVVVLEPGRPFQVRTAAGAVLAADEVVCCAGRWIPELTAAANMIPLIPWDTPGATAPGLVVQAGPTYAAGPPNSSAGPSKPSAA
jgi:glycine/D-amino acid oxidase-like deaminating enzyme